MVIGWEAWYTIAVLILIVGALLKEVARPELVFLGGLGLLLLAGIISPEQAFAGFSNTAVLVVAALFVVAAGIERTQALASVDRMVFDTSSNSAATLWRMMTSTSFLSAFLNNTPIVAMFIPRVRQYASRAGIAPSKLLIPLSYATITGGMITLIGTSTNVVVSGLLEAEGHAPFNMFDLTWVGLPAAIVVTLYFLLIGHRTLPDRRRKKKDLGDGLETCLFEVRVASRSDLIGRSVEEAGLRALGEAYLVHIRRQGRLMPARPDEVLQYGDVLTFVGNVSMLDRLLERPGLERVLPSVEAGTENTLPLYQAVVAEGSNLVGKTLRDVSFREHYGGVVLGIQRKNEIIQEALGRVPIRSGDLLLVEAANGFDKRWNAERDTFYLVGAYRPEVRKPLKHKAPLALAIMLVMIIIAALNIMPLVTATFIAALCMIATRCLSMNDARRAVDISVLIVIAAALGIGRAVEDTGLAALIAHSIVGVTAGAGITATLIALYVTTNMLTELITHKAAAVLMLPVALTVAADLGLDPRALAIVITVGAAASFMTPIGYQTNLMVMAAGGYRYRDYLKAGIPVSLIVMTITILVIRVFWL